MPQRSVIDSASGVHTAGFPRQVLQPLNPNTLQHTGLDIGQGMRPKAGGAPFMRLTSRSGRQGNTANGAIY